MTSCPYMLPADIWTNDPTNWPALEYPEVYSYLIDTPGVFTKEAMNNRISLEADGYVPFFTMTSRQQNL